MTQALYIARYLIHLAHQEPEPDPLTHLRLQKLLYYVQGWSLAWRGRPAFESTIEAWRHGPVVVEVYPVFAAFADASIPPSEGSEFVPLSDEDKAFVASVWEGYKRYSASQLWRMTHAERPWQEAWGDRGPSDSGREPVDPESIRDWFGEQLRRRTIPGLEPRAIAESEDELANGRGIRLDDLVKSFDG